MLYCNTKHSDILRGSSRVRCYIFFACSQTFIEARNWHVILVGCCTNVWACPKLFEITSCQYLWKQMSSCLVFLYMAKHRWKLPIDYVIFVGCGPVRACPKFSEITNYKNLEKEFRDYFLHAGRHTWKPQSNHAILVGWFQACPSLPKVLRTANCQYFWKGWVIISVLCK